MKRKGKPWKRAEKAGIEQEYKLIQLGENSGLKKHSHYVQKINSKYPSQQSISGN